MEQLEAPYILGIISGILIITGSLLILFVMPFFMMGYPMWGMMGYSMWYHMSEEHGLNYTIPYYPAPAYFFWAPAFIAFMIIGIASGIIVLYSAFKLREGKNISTWGALILAFSLISFLGGGGFFVGAILGIIAGILALAFK